jgi:peptide-methionine (S)-S-oxide reductase
MDDTGRYGRATFAVGSFWDAEAAFRRVNGVVATAAGYTGGSLANPTYERVSRGKTGHAEAVEVVFDPAVVTYHELLEVFWDMHDPTEPGRFGTFTGPQYRSAIFYHNGSQKTAALASRTKVEAAGKSGNKPLATEILPAPEFWLAEECHQQFYEKSARSYCTTRQLDE